MNLRQLEVFHAIMRTGSVTAAARLLNVSQPAISAVLKHCEIQLKMPLFTRAGGRLMPTPEAQALYPDVAAVFTRLDAVSRLTQDLVGGRLGSLSVAGAFPIANGYLAEAVATYSRERPGVRVALLSLTSPQVIDRVVSGEVELGIAYDPIVSSAVETELLTRSAIVCVMPADCPLAKQTEVDVSDLEPYSIITYLPQALLRTHVDRAFSEAGIAPKIAVQVGLSLTGMMLAYHGAGIALVEAFLPNTLRLPGLVWRPLNPRIQLSTRLIIARDVTLSKSLTDFIAHLKEIMTKRYQLAL